MSASPRDQRASIPVLRRLVAADVVSAGEGTAPRDPRFFMQGDYMALSYDLANKLYTLQTSDAAPACRQRAR